MSVLRSQEFSSAQLDEPRLDLADVRRFLRKNRTGERAVEDLERASQLSFLVQIALFLGHESLETTNKYLAASVRLKRQTLESLPRLGLGRRRPSRREQEKLIQLLESLQRTGRVQGSGLAATREPLVTP